MSKPVADFYQGMAHAFLLDVRDTIKKGLFSFHVFQVTRKDAVKTILEEGEPTMATAIVSDVWDQICKGVESPTTAMFELRELLHYHEDFLSAL